MNDNVIISIIVVSALMMLVCVADISFYEPCLAIVLGIPIFVFVAGFLYILVMG